MDSTREHALALIFEEIKGTLDYSSGEWGPEFDDNNTANDWIQYICTLACKGGKVDLTVDEFQQAMLQVAGLAISALEAVERNGGLPPRHYDGMPNGGRLHVPAEIPAAMTKDEYLAEMFEEMDFTGELIKAETATVPTYEYVPYSRSLPGRILRFLAFGMGFGH